MPRSSPYYRHGGSPLGDDSFRKGQNQGRKYICKYCLAEGIIREFDSMAALNGHIRMAHKSSPKRKKKAKQIEKALDKIAGVFAGEPKRKYIRHNGYEIMEVWMTPKLEKIIKEALEQSKNYDAKVLPVVLVLSKLGLLKVKWLI